jgi:hypothetical protein
MMFVWYLRRLPAFRNRQTHVAPLNLLTTDPQATDCAGSTGEFGDAMKYPERIS